MKDQLLDTLSAINQNRDLLKQKFKEENEKLEKLDSQLSSIDKKLDALATATVAEEEKIEHELEVLNLKMEKSLYKNEELKKVFTEFHSAYVANVRRENRAKLETEHEKLMNLVYPAMYGPFRFGSCS